MDIIVQDLSKSFNKKMVLKNFSTVIGANKRTCVMGPSGSGKTTLLNILMGLTAPDSGTVQGVPQKKSAVFQEERLCESFSAIANVRLVCSNDVSTEKIKEHLDRIGLKDSKCKPVIELSGGMRRRVSIVRAILAESEIIFMDEPFKGLDEETKKNVIKYVLDNTVNKTLLMVTHDPEEIETMQAELIYISMEGTDDQNRK